MILETSKAKTTDLQMEHLRVIDIILKLWQNLPTNQLPDKREEKIMKFYEAYSDMLAEELIYRGVLGPDWNKR